MTVPDPAAAVAEGRAARHARYLAYVADYPQWFAGAADGLVIATDTQAIARIEDEMARRYAAVGHAPEWAQVGVRYQDPYLMVLVDAVTFPDGGVGVHHRVVRPAGDTSGVAILPVLDGKIVLIRHFRHPLRRWCWEIPRGAIERGASAEDTVRVELAEEIEGRVAEVEPLGEMYGATGFMGLAVKLYLARLTAYGAPALGEGVAEVRLVGVEECEAMIRRSEIVDSFTLGAFLHARLKGRL